ncbi:MAG: alpha-L-rhamnosidase C-terminal domain-containing protein, partial [Cyclobacteriaceae bacterium]
IESVTPGFKEVIIRPATGFLKEVSGTMPHPNGEISTSYKKLKSGGLECVIVLPKDLLGSLIIHDQSYQLKEGVNTLIVDNKISLPKNKSRSQ